MGSWYGDITETTRIQYPSHYYTICLASPNGRAIKKNNIYQKDIFYILSKYKSICIKKISHKELRLPLQTALAALRHVNLDMQMSWRAAL